MMYVGIDYHKNFSFATKMDEKGKIIDQMKFLNDPESIQQFAQTLEKDSKLVLEATGSWYYFYEQMENKAGDIILSHPSKTRAIAEARIKTDKIDSETLAHLLRADLIPQAYIPKREVRDVREILRYRVSLVSLRVMIKNKIHAILSKNGIKLPCTDIFGTKGITLMKALQLRDSYQQTLQGYLSLLNSLSEQIKKITETIETIAKNNEEAILLTSIPGIGYYSALLLISEIGDIHRFPSAKKLCSYAGLVPSVHSSGGKTYIGRITKQGSKWIRTALVEVSFHFIRSPGHFQSMYERIKKRSGATTARVAIAREMLKVIYSMLMHHRPFRSDHLVVSA